MIEPPSSQIASPASAKTNGLASQMARARKSEALETGERLGLEGALNAAKALAATLGGWATPPRVPAGGPPLQNPHLFSGPGCVDLIAFCAEAILVLEAKGCGSSPGLVTFEGRRRIRQGTPRYLRAIARCMTRSADPQQRAAGRALDAALRTGEPPVRYLEARTRIDPTSGEATPTILTSYGNI